MLVKAFVGPYKCCKHEHLLFPDASPVGEVFDLQCLSPLDEVGKVNVDYIVANEDVRIGLYDMVTPSLQRSKQKLLGSMT